MPLLKHPFQASEHFSLRGHGYAHCMFGWTLARSQEGEDIEQAPDVTELRLGAGGHVRKKVVLNPMTGLAQVWELEACKAPLIC